MVKIYDKGSLMHREEEYRLIHLVFNLNVLKLLLSDLFSIPIVAEQYSLGTWYKLGIREVI